MSEVLSSPTAKKRLSLKEWAQIERLYAEGNTTLQALAEQFSTPIRTIQAHLNKAKIVKGTVVPSPAANEEKDTPQNTFHDDSRAYQSEARKISLLMAQHVKASLEKLPPGPAHAGQLLKLASAANKMNQFAKEIGISVEPEEAMPGLIVMELTADQIEAMRQQQRLEDEEISPSIKYGHGLDEEDEPDDDGIVSESRDIVEWRREE